MRPDPSLGDAVWTGRHSQPGASGGCEPDRCGIRADRWTVGIAIVDSGIDIGRPEFNLRGVVSFIPSAPSAQDDFGHGTHVAAIAAANTMPAGFRGVAARAPLWALKVLDSTGVGDDAQLIAAIDWLTANGPPLGVRVAKHEPRGQREGHWKLRPVWQHSGGPLALRRLPISPGWNMLHRPPRGTRAADAASLVPAAYPGSHRCLERRGQ